MPHRFTYPEIYRTLRAHLLAEAPTTTRQTTDAIKRYFRNTFNPDYSVLCSHEDGCEYIADVLVSSFNPKNVVARRTLDITVPTVRIRLAVESELGGVSASSAYGVMKNVVEDYLKLLVVRADLRVLIFTSLPYRSEPNHIIARVEKLRELYARTPELNSGVLLVHLEGTQPRSSQVQTVVSAQSIRGFIVSNCGKHFVEIEDEV